MMGAKRKADEAFAHTLGNKQLANGDNQTSQPPKYKDHQKPNLRDKAQALLKQRQQLPIWPHADDIRHKVHQNDVVLLVGETGSGKSTQIPQFLCTEDWCQSHTPASSYHHDKRQSKSHQRIGGRIAIIQPRRVAAISLATRVAAEIGTPLGNASTASQVGYSVRFDNNVGPATKIKFLTDGMLLQELLRDPWLREYSCVIVDEVHERGLNVDLVMGFLRRILEVGRRSRRRRGGEGEEETKNQLEKDGRGGVPLKVVVMSATADMQSIEMFFRDAKVVDDEDGANSDGEGWAGFPDGEPQQGKAQPATDSSHPKSNINVASCLIKGRQYSVTLTYSPLPITNLLDAAMEKIIHIHQHSPLPGDVLVFLSGQEMIENLESLCHTYASTITDQGPQQQSSPFPKKDQKPKLPSLQVLPLFAALPTHLQSRIFHPTPPFTRRIILATNIAETSITVPGIRHVIDTGKHKSRLFRPGLNLDTLLSSPISQSMAKQRTGRAGREALGNCYRLYTEKDYLLLERDTKPEILSTDLSFLVLTLKAHGVEDVLHFPLLTEPPRRSLESALEGLLNLDALDAETGKISEVGKKMAMLPVRPDLARILLEGSRYGGEVLEGIIDVVAALSLEEGIFLPIHSGQNQKLKNGQKTPTKELLLGKGTSTIKARDATLSDNGSDSDNETLDPIEAARRQLLSRHSDHLTLINAIRAYSSPSTHDRRAWCDTHRVSHRAMSRITDVRKQLRQMLANKKHTLPRRDESPASLHKSSSLLTTKANESTHSLTDLTTKTTILQCLTCGLWPNIAVLTSLAPQQQQAGIHKAKQNPNQRAPYTTLLTNQPIHIHPSSVLFTQRAVGGGNRKARGQEDKEAGASMSRAASSSTMPPAIVFTDLIYTSKPYARNVSAVELSWVAEMGKLG